LGFLGPRRFAVKIPVYEGWISLDFLGFSRQNLDFSMGYERKALENISRALPPGGAALKWERAGTADAEGPNWS
jgi:hypothetical protein